MPQIPFDLFTQFPELTLELWTKDDQVNTHDHLQRYFGDRSLAIPKQVHGNRTIVTRKPMIFSEDADGIVTDHMDLTVAVRMADCQTFAVYAPTQRVIGVLHAGWRGLIKNAIPSFFDVLAQNWHIEPRETFVAAGPSLCQKCAEFSDPTNELPDIDPKFFNGRLVDLRGIADTQLDVLGVPQTQRERHPDCTRCQPEKYWSYRGPDRDRVREGWENLLSVRIHERQEIRDNISL